MGIHDLWLFVVAGLLLNITPGPDMALIIARSTKQGTGAGVVAALGIATGLFVHILAAAIGVSAIVLASAVAFTALKWIGALYLIYLGVQMVRSSSHTNKGARQLQSLPPMALRHVFAQGFLTNVLNPKIALFFLAFVPQFVDSNASSKAAAFITLGLLFNGVGTAWNFGVAWFAGALAGCNGYRRVRTSLEWALAVLFVGLGLRLALTERP